MYKQYNNGRMCGRTNNIIELIYKNFPLTTHKSKSKFNNSKNNLILSLIEVKTKSM